MRSIILLSCLLFAMPAFAQYDNSAAQSDASQQRFIDDSVRVNEQIERENQRQADQQREDMARERAEHEHDGQVSTPSGWVR